MTEYIPIINYIEKPDKSIFKSKVDIKYATTIAFPKFSYGFHHFNHATKKQMENFKKFNEKKKVYLVINEFETTVDDYEDDIDNAANKMFKINPSSSFYNMWEILFLFNIADSKTITSVHISDTGTKHVDAFLEFRTKYFNSKNDKYYGVIVYNDSKIDDSKPTSKKSSNITLLSTIVKDKKTADTIKKEIGKSDIVTAEINIMWTKHNIQEQTAFKSIFLQILTAIKLQKKGGHFVLRVFETLTIVSIKIIAMLAILYKDVHICKPFTSKSFEQERYIVCQKFLFDDNEIKNEIKALEDIVDSFSDTNNIVDIFTSYSVPDKFSESLTESNTRNENHQFKYINQMIDFINKQNYFGDVYHSYRDTQIKANKFWIDTFLNKNHEILRKIV